MAVFQKPEAFVLSREAGEDLSSKLYFFGTLNSSEQIVVAGDGVHALGVIIEGGTSGVQSSIQFGGIAKVKLGGTVSIMGPVASDGSGNGVAATSGEHVMGVALQGGVSGDIIPVALVPGQVA